MWLRWRILLGFSILVLTPTAFSDSSLEVNEDLYIYRKPVKSKPILILESGQTVPISRRRYGKKKEFLRVVIPYKGKKRGGYIRIDAIKDSVILADEDELPDFTPSGDRSRGGGVRPRYAGLSLGPQFFQQGSSELQSDNEQTFSVSSLSGLGYGAQFFADFPMSDSYSITAYVAYRISQIKGSASLVLSGSNSDTSDFERKQNLLGFGIGFKYFGSSSSKWWYGAHFEMGKVLSSTLTLSDSTVESDVSSIPLKFLVFAHAGYEMQINYSWYFLPELSLGSIVNGEPIAFIFQLMLPIAWTF